MTGQHRTTAAKPTRQAHKTDGGTKTHASETKLLPGSGSAHDAQVTDDLASASVLRELAKDARVTIRKAGNPDPDGKCVVYWMQRAERGTDNPALDCAVNLANALALPVVVYFAGISNFPHANLRHYAFLNQGLRDVKEDLAKRNISFVLRNAPREDHLRLFQDVHAAIVVGDENPMRIPEGWRRDIASGIKVPFWTVDADVVVPSLLFEKAQYAAYTFRPRLWKLVPDFLHPCDNPSAKHAWNKPSHFVEDDPAADMTDGWNDLDRTVGPVPTLLGGTHAGMARLRHFVDHLLPNYDEHRNKPEMDGTSLLSPYLHYGHLSPVTIALAVQEAARKHPKLRKDADSFLDELITWRELCINFVKYNPHYDDPGCAEEWAKTTVANHAKDVRDPVYSLKQLERAETYDELWNAAQRQMVRCGWMHNYMRMYWAKKVLEWSPDNATAMKHLIYLNDKYFLDGRDPGGYGGIAWAIYGKFDRPWGERKIFGKIRYMSGASTGRKFNSKEYIRQNQP